MRQHEQSADQHVCVATRRSTYAWILKDPNFVGINDAPAQGEASVSVDHFVYQCLAGCTAFCFTT